MHWLRYIQLSIYEWSQKSEITDTLASDSYINKVDGGGISLTLANSISGTAA
jgi:hypothetical protein